MRKKNRFSTRTLVVTGMLSAISIVMGMTPLGYIPLPVANLTTMHIPAILGAILEGPLVGLAVGLIFGLTSLYKAAVAPTSLMSPFFLNPLVSVLPRLLIGPAAYFAYVGVKKLFVMRAGKLRVKAPLVDSIAAGAAAFAGTLTNTAGVLSMIGLLYARAYAEIAGIDPSAVAAAIWAVCVGNGLLEAAAAVVIVVALERVLRPVLDHSAARHKKRGGKKGTEARDADRV